MINMFFEYLFIERLPGVISTLRGMKMGATSKSFVIDTRKFAWIQFSPLDSNNIVNATRLVLQLGIAFYSATRRTRMSLGVILAEGRRLHRPWLFRSL